jgi:hypothetical protein
VTSSPNSSILNFGYAITVSGTSGSYKVTGYTPATFMYVATDTNNNLHVYALNLASSTTPVATQVSNLSLALPSGNAINTVICDYHGAYTNVLDPTSIFVVLHIAGTTGCSTTGDVWEVVHYKDSASTAPTVVNITSTSIEELYAPSGLLAGLLMEDGNGSDQLYTDDTFTSASTIITGGNTVISTMFSADDLAFDGSVFTGTVLFLTANTGGGTQNLYRLPYNATTATLEYTGVGTLSSVAVADGTNLYFTDDSGTQSILQEPLAGGPTVTLLSNFATSAATSSYELIGSNGSLLVVENSTTTNAGAGIQTYNFATLPVGTLSTSATVIDSSITGSSLGVQFVSSFMAPQTVGNRATDLVFVSVVNSVPSPSGTPYSYATEILKPSGTAPQALTAATYFPSQANNLLSTSVLQLVNIATTYQIDALSLASLTPTALKQPGGTVYTPGSDGFPFLIGLSPTIAGGQLITAPVGNSINSSIPGLAVDFSQSLIVPITPNTGSLNTNTGIF